MGLDITYYKLGKLVEVEEGIEAYSQEFYDKYGDLLHIDEMESYTEQTDSLDEGYYEIDRLGGFRAGSYSGYSWYRTALRRLSLMVMKKNKELSEKYDEDAFEQQLDFSDCEGIIGPFTSVELFNTYSDFEKPIIHDIIKMAKYGVDESIYETYTKDELGHFVALYREWKMAFEKTSGIGVVYFH